MQNSIVGFRSSPQQRWLWSFWKSVPTPVVRCVVRIAGELDRKRLRDAIQAAVRRHEILRTNLEVPAGLSTPFQLIDEGLQPVWAEDADQESPAVTAGGPRPVVRLSLQATAPQTHSLVIEIAHLQGDAASLRNLVQEIAALYSAPDAGTARLPPPLQYADASEWLNGAIEAEDASRQEGKKFWHDHRPVLASPAIPIEFRGAPLHAAMDGIDLSLDAAATATIESLSQRLDVAVSDVALSCWASLLWRLGDQPTIGIACIAEGRTRQEMEGAVGVFAKPFPLRVGFETEPSFAEVCQQVRAARGEAEKRLDYLTLEDAYGTVETAAALPVGFEFSTFTPSIQAGGVSFSIDEPQSQQYPFKVKLGCRLGADGLAIRLEYHSGLCRRADMERIGQYFLDLLRLAMENPQLAVADHDFLLESGRRQIIEEFSGAKGEFRLDRCFHELFEEQAALTPDALALVFEEVPHPNGREAPGCGILNPETQS